MPVRTMKRSGPEIWGDRPSVTGLGGRMIDHPHRGTMQVLSCRACSHTLRLTGRQIAVRFTTWLSAPVAEWASTLICSRCRSSSVLVSTAADNSAQGFHTSTQETGPIIWCRRLNAYLSEVKADLWDYRDILRDPPSPHGLESAGIRRCR